MTDGLIMLLATISAVRTLGYAVATFREKNIVGGVFAVLLSVACAFLGIRYFLTG